MTTLSIHRVVLISLIKLMYIIHLVHQDRLVDLIYISVLHVLVNQLQLVLEVTLNIELDTLLLMTSYMEEKVGKKEIMFMYI